MTPNIQEQDMCCPEFNPELWKDKEHVWKDKLFVRDYVRQIFHMPLNMGKVMTRMDEKIRAEKAELKGDSFLTLSYDPSPWKSEMYIAVSKEVSGMESVRLSGKFISKVYEGPYNHVPKWITDFDSYLNEKGLKSLKYYFYYTTCPKCAKKYGHNYVVVFAQISE